MLDLVKEKCDLLANNHRAINKKFAFEKNLICLTASLVFTVAGKEADLEKLAECKKMLGKQTTLFSELRGTAELLVAAKMALSEEPEKVIASVKTVYEKIQKSMKIKNVYAVLAALLICDFEKQDSCEEYIKKAADLMAAMNKEHPVLTNSGDTANVMLLALSYKDTETILKDLEEGYLYLKKTCKLHADSDAIQELCEFLALSYGDMKEKCDRVVRLLGAFSEKKANYGTCHELASLGAFADPLVDISLIVDEVLEAEAYLKEKKGWEDKNMERKKRMMYAALLVADSREKSTNVISNPVISNTVGYVTDQQIVDAISIATSLISSFASSLDSPKTK